MLVTEEYTRNYRIKKNTVAMVFQIRTGLSLQRLRVSSAEMGCRELVGVIYYFAFIYIYIFNFCSFII